MEVLKDKKDRVGIVAVRCCDIDNLVPNVSVEKCSFCGSDVYITPASQKIRFDVIYCEACWRADYNEKEDSAHVTKETFDEFNEWFKGEYGYKMSDEDMIKMIKEKLKINVTLKEISEIDN